MTGRRDLNGGTNVSDVTTTQSPHRQLGAFRHAVVGTLLGAPPARGQLAAELDNRHGMAQVRRQAGRDANEFSLFALPNGLTPSTAATR
jgi:hypothetical protein